MKEVKSPKKPLIYYYVIVLLVLAAFNFFVSPLLLSRQVTEVDYGTFMSMTEKKNIGRVEVEDSQIIFTDKIMTTYTKQVSWMIQISQNDFISPVQPSQKTSSRRCLLS